MYCKCNAWINATYDKILSLSQFALTFIQIHITQQHNIQLQSIQNSAKHQQWYSKAPYRNHDLLDQYPF